MNLQHESQYNDRNKTMQVVGIDPGLASLGWGVVESAGLATGKYVSHGVIETKSNLSLPMRLLEIEQKFDSLLSRFEPTVLAYEQQFFVKNISSGLEVAHALGVILLYCAKQNLPTAMYTPTKIKKNIVGNARAKKESVERFVCMQLKIDSIKPHHASDALAVALVHCQMNTNMVI